MTADLKPCEAFAIVGPDGQIMLPTVALDEHDAWNCIAIRLKSDTSGYRAIPVTITPSAQPAEEPVAWCREWEGDESDLGNMIVVFDATERDAPVERWHPLYTKPVPADPETQAAIEQQLKRIQELTNPQPAEAMRMLADCKEKLGFYRQAWGGEYVGGIEYTALIKRIDALLGGNSSTGKPRT